MRLQRIVLVVLSLAFVGFQATSGLAQEQKKKAKSETVKGSGCVRPGVEAGCLVLKDFNDAKKQYSLHFPPDKKPDPGTAISFEGTKLDSDICMQGLPVTVTKWTRLKTICPKE